MPTGSEPDGRGPTDPSPDSPTGEIPEPQSVTKGGPFDLEEMERLANEMFRALPGAFLPGLDPEQGSALSFPAAAESLRPAAGWVPTSNGHVEGRAEALRDLAPESGWTTARGPEHANGTAPERWSYLPTSRQTPATPATLPPSGRGHLFALGGDPVPLSELGLSGLPRSMGQDPFANSLYVLEDATRPMAFVDATSVPAAIPERAATGIPRPPFDVEAVRREFPVLAERVHGQPLVWLDNGATTQKPNAVIERLDHFYRHENSNIHRGAHELAARATDAYEAGRDKVARFLHAPSREEIVFVRGTTEAINLVAQSWGRANVRSGDEVLITWLEHHANIVPWQRLCQETGAHLCVAPVDDTGQVLLDEYERLLSDRTRLVAFTHVSNALGTILPVREMTELAHRRGARVLIDGAQAVAHAPVDVQSLDSDWYAFSGHKVFGPTGIGVLHGKRDLLNSMPPWQGGGNMISDVTFDRTVYQSAPVRFEAGTTSIADAVGLGAAIDYIEAVGLESIARYEHDLLIYATAGLSTIPGLHLIGTAPSKAATLSFVLDGFSPEEVGQALNRKGIAVRAGHHCAQPIVRRFGHESTVRASLAFYNTCEDVDALINALHQIATRSFSVS